MPVQAAADSSLWNIQKSDHFLVYFQEAEAGYTDELISKAEDYYQTITQELGFTRFEDFWTWDKRAKIYLFKDRETYQQMSHQPAWSDAGVNVANRQIITYVNKQGFFEVTLPHELGHIIFREFVGADRKLPLWLDEGVASFAQEKQYRSRLLLAKKVVNTEDFMDLEELSNVEKVKLAKPEVFYAEVASIIVFLIKAYGKDRFMEFCRCLRELRPDQDWLLALTDTYKFKDLSEMNEEWIKFLLKS